MRVPNDFTELQICAQKKTVRRQWWVAIPDHVNYFNCESIAHLVESRGFKVLKMITDFPMELFLLMGDNYINNPQIGSECHKKRVKFELSISHTLRRKLYQNLANVGVGRDITLWAKLN